MPKPKPNPNPNPNPNQVVPMYRVERAKSGRSRCQAKGSAQSAECARDDLIAKVRVRVS